MKTEKESQLADGRGGGEGARSYDAEKAWSSINHSVLSGRNHAALISLRRPLIIGKKE
jgi:hypothetical protein